MTVGVVDPNPLTAGRALIKVEQNELEDCPYRADDGSEQMQFRSVLMVLRGAGERDGETFVQYWTFPATGKIKPGTKTGQFVTAALRGHGTADTLEELAEALVGKAFAAEIGTSKDGKYSRVVHDTIGPAPEPRREPEPPKDDPEDDFNDIPW